MTIPSRTVIRDLRNSRGLRIFSAVISHHVISRHAYRAGGIAVSQRKTRRPSAPTSITLSHAISIFFADRQLAQTTKRTYENAFRVLVDELGGRYPIGKITNKRLVTIYRRHWGTRSAATWNGRVAAIVSLSRYAKRQGWTKTDPTGGLERKRLAHREARSIAYDELAALWSRKDVKLRERLFWRMLYSTAARAVEILSLNIEDLDIPRKRARVRAKGGAVETVVWDAGTARLLPRYIAGRKKGPLFITSGLPNVVPADVDRSPDGRARLSYQRAWALFKSASENRWTLHQIRHSALSHLGDDGVAAPLLMAKSRHRDLRTLGTYVRPSIEAVARLTAEHDPERRRRM